MLGRFILGSEVDAEFIERYAAAHQHLWGTSSQPGEAAVLSLAIRNSLLLPCLAAAAALVGRETLLHKKSLLMAAVLEASPRYADSFLPRPTGAVRLVLLLVWTGIATMAQLVVGLPILWIMGRRA